MSTAREKSMTKAAAKPKGKTTHKSFGDALKSQERVNLVALCIYNDYLVFRGDKELAFRPRQGTQIFRIWDDKKLSMRQQRAWKKFRDQCEAALGRSGGVTSSYGAATGTSEPSEKTLVSYTNKDYQQAEFLVNSYLTAAERALLNDLIQNDLKAGDKFQIEHVGFIRSGFTKDEEAFASGVTHVHNLLDRIASFYNF